MNARPPNPSASSSASSLKNSTIFRKFSASLLRRKFTHPAWNPMRTKATLGFLHPQRFLVRGSRTARKNAEMQVKLETSGQLLLPLARWERTEQQHINIRTIMMSALVPGECDWKRRRSGMEAIRDFSDVSGHPLHRHSRQSASHRAFVAGTFAEFIRTLFSTVTTAIWVVRQTLSGCLSGGTRSWHA